ncbi:hypothetical protein OS176_02495 [Xanthomonadaceae bacterium XH05]|nr:hypothetical protein [Xanthomonadaceae bacterium XH05]
MSVLLFYAAPEFLYGKYVDAGEINSVEMDDEAGEREKEGGERKKIRLNELVELTCKEVDGELDAALYWVGVKDEPKEARLSRIKDALTGAGANLAGLASLMRISSIADRNIRGWWSDAYSILASPDAICGPRGRWGAGVIPRQSLLHSSEVQSRLLNEIAAARTISWIARTGNAMALSNVDYFFNQIKGECAAGEEKCEIIPETYSAFVCGMSQFRMTDRPLSYFADRDNYEVSRKLKKEGSGGYDSGVDICSGDNKQRGTLAGYFDDVEGDFGKDRNGVWSKKEVAKLLDQIFSDMDGGGIPLLVTVNVGKGEKEGRFIYAKRVGNCIGPKNLCGIRIIAVSCDYPTGVGGKNGESIKVIEDCEKSADPGETKDPGEIQWCRSFSSSWASASASASEGKKPGACASLWQPRADSANGGGRSDSRMEVK